MEHRSAGILLHVTSLPGRFGIGDFGAEARRFVDLLAEAGLKWWQILPMTPATGGNPYVSSSAFAGFTALISPEELVREGLLSKKDLWRAGSGEGKVDYANVARMKGRMLERVWLDYRAGRVRDVREEFERFCAESAEWLDDFAMFTVLRQVFKKREWQRWPGELAKRRAAAMREARRLYSGEIERECFGQFLFFRQYAALKRYANERGVELFGDVPIFVSGDSADVWAHARQFKTDKNGWARAVAGTPPDMFCKRGQRWGNPVYDWAAMRRDGYAWWTGRMRAALGMYDLVRIDHFRAFAAAWEIPAGKGADEGKWVKGPGAKFFEHLRGEFGEFKVVAEDLGFITADVEKLRDDFGLAGMRVLQFGFDHLNSHSLENHVENAVAYTGTHDNDTTEGWWRVQHEKVRRWVREMIGDDVNWPRISQMGTDGAVSRGMIGLAWRSKARMAVAPMQDVLGLGSEARMNRPGTGRGNWRWRMREEDLGGEWLGWLRELTRVCGRSSGGEGS